MRGVNGHRQLGQPQRWSRPKVCLGQFGKFRTTRSGVQYRRAGQVLRFGHDVLLSTKRKAQRWAGLVWEERAKGTEGRDAQGPEAGYAMAQVSLQGSRVVSFIGQGEPAGMPQHVGMSREAELGSLASALYKLGKAARGERRAALRGKHERRFGVLLALQPA